MNNHSTKSAFQFALSIVILFLGAGYPALGDWQLGPEQVVRADGADILVPGYSVPSFMDWNNDGKPDLIVGEGGSGFDGKVRVYPNIGTSSEPQFADYQYVQSFGTDLVVGSAGCLGVFPRLMDYDADGSQDLILGLANGEVGVYLNTAIDQAPAFATFRQIHNADGSARAADGGTAAVRRNSHAGRPLRIACRRAWAQADLADSNAHC